MKGEHALRQTANSRQHCIAMLHKLGPAVRDWAGSDGLTWLHLLKTVMAGLLALGMAMLLDLPQPRIAVTTVFVLMQPFSGMVLAKSFYRILGTAAGTIAALALGGLFVQQPELYMLGMTAWVSACVAAAVRYRHFRWYGFVLAGYTAALIGIPNVTAPLGLLLAALTRAAEIAVGIVSSSAVSALVMPQRSSLALQRALRKRYDDFTVFAADVLNRRVVRGRFERRFARLIDEIVGFEATRIFAAFEDPAMRSRSAHLSHLNGEFMDSCTRLHALHQLLKRLRANHLTAIIAAIEPYFHELASLITSQPGTEIDAANVAARLQEFRAGLPRRMRQTRRQLETAPAESLADFDTAAELLYRFVDEWSRYSLTDASLTLHGAPVRTRGTRPYMSRTNRLVVAFTFVRCAAVMAVAGWFWIVTNWPSGGFAVIGAALACALTSATPGGSRMALHMAVGAVMATMTGYLYTCYVYPNIDGFPLLCVTLAPVLALGAFIATRKGAAGYGIGFTVFFCLLAGPDNVVTYAPDLLINNGIALTASMLLAALSLAVVFPADMPWLVRRIMRDLRGQVSVACKGELSGLNQRFQSGAHDLTSQLRMLLTRRSRCRRDALRWMLATLEVGHAVIDLRNESAHADYANQLHPVWRSGIERVLADLAELFERPDKETLERALRSVRSATLMAGTILQTVHAERDKRHDLQRILSCLHFIRTALLDNDAPFKAC